MFKVKVYVTPKAGISDPQGATIERALPALGFDGVGSIRVGRLITLEVDGADAAVVGKDVEAMCRQLLANPIIEEYRFELEASGPFAAAMAAPEDVVVSADTPLRVAGEHAGSPWTAADPYAHRQEQGE
jgi:phosphoribosylformylglycinamidine synthase PurS subunit